MQKWTARVLRKTCASVCVWLTSVLLLSVSIPPPVSLPAHLSVLWAKDRNDAFDNVYKSILDKSSVQKVKEGSLVVRGRRDATSESLDTAGPELKYSTYVDGDVLFIRVIFASDDWATHSLDVKYEITNAVCRSNTPCRPPVLVHLPTIFQALIRGVFAAHTRLQRRKQAPCCISSTRPGPIGGKCPYDLPSGDRRCVQGGAEGPEVAGWAWHA
jgi:hypothetical protein